MGKYLIYIENEKEELEISVDRAGIVTTGPAYNHEKTWRSVANGVAFMEKGLSDAGLQITRHPELDLNDSRPGIFEEDGS